MRITKLSVVLLSALLLCLALGSQAQAAGWRIAGAAFPTGEKEVVGEGTSLVINSPSFGVSIKCKKWTSKESIIGGGTGKGSWTLSECEIPGAPACALGPISFSLKYVLEPPYLIISPLSGTTFVTFAIVDAEEGSEECVLSGIWSLKGTMVAETEDPGTEAVINSRTFSSAVSKAGGVSLSIFGAHQAILEGVLSQKLSTGSKWGIEGPATTKLCKASEGSCEPYELSSKIAASLEEDMRFSFLFEGKEVEVPCKESTVEGITTKKGVTQIGEVTSLAFAKCGGGLCTVTAQHLPYKVEVSATSGGNGTMTWVNKVNGQPSFKLECLGTLKCNYGAKSISFTMTGGNPAKISGNAVSLELEAGSGEKCGASNAKVDGVGAEGKIKYKITAPSPLFVRR